MTEDTGSGCAPVFIGVILAAGLLLFGVLVLVPAVGTWQEGNARTAEIEAQARATVAQIEAQRDIQVAQEEARRDVLIAQQQTQAAVQLAALDLAGDAMHGAQNTLMAVLLGIFGAFCLVVAGAGVYAFWRLEHAV